ncbi:MAG: prepilin-type N-terminal cleavage/methylation domain-containing protein [Candidatus Chisholmbacteria bacterium]|nr:prepilin-type N-terminal cleavage/methylation domain-containing protein [Candidatus Chisholmbacteria bacterium]
MRKVLPRFSKGFTLIEILIVIILIGILAIAVLAAINPVELVRKGRDTQRQADARELLGAYDRFYTTYGCYPWNGTDCSGTTVRAGVNPNFGTPATDDELLIEQGEIKAQFANRASITDADLDKRLFVSEDAAGVVSVCFEPESIAGRSGEIAALTEVTNTTAATCGAGPYPDTTCYICLPQ